MTVLGKGPLDTIFTLQTTLVAADRDVIEAGIRAYNDTANADFRRARQPGQGREPLDIFLRDGDGQIVGGLTASTIWDWLQVADLWLPEPLRGQGIGVRLVRYAVAEARRRGCTQAELKTFSFQARGFYEKLGFRVVGQLDGYPPGHALYWLRLAFDEFVEGE